MPLSIACKGDGAVNWDGAAEQAALLGALYERGPDFVLEIVRVKAGEAGIIAARTPMEPGDFRPASAPAWVCFVHDGQYWLVVAGTRTTGQWIANVTGALVIAPKMGDQPGAYNSYWAAMSEAIYSEIGPRMVGNLPLNCSGHSLGGVVAWGVACISKQRSERTSRVVTFGSPRQERGSYGGAPPDCQHDVQTFADIVTYLPPNTLPLPVPKWAHQPPVKVIEYDGTVLDDDANDGEVDINAAWNADWGPHHISYYVHALKEIYLQHPDNLTTGRVLAGAGYVSGLPLAVLVDPIINPAVTTMAISKVSFIFNVGRNGWTEQYYYSGNANPNDVYDDAKQFAVKRAELLTRVVQPDAPGAPVADYLIEAIRVSRVPATSPGRLFSGSGLPILAPLGNPQFADRDNVVFAYGYSAGGTVSRRLEFRGVPSAWVNGNLNNRRGPFSAALQNAFNVFKLFLQLNPQWGMYFQNPTGEVNITGMTTNGDGQLVITAPGLVTGVNQYVVLRGIRGDGTTRLGGRARVIAVGTGNTFTLSTVKCSRCEFRFDSLGKVAPQNMVFTPFSDLVLSGFGNRKIGRAFFLTLGRQRKCCK